MLSVNVQTRIPKREVKAIDNLKREGVVNSRSDFIRKAVSHYLIEVSKVPKLLEEEISV